MHAFGIHIGGDDVHAGLFWRADFHLHRAFTTRWQRNGICLGQNLNAPMAARSHSEFPLHRRVVDEPHLHLARFAGAQRGAVRVKRGPAFVDAVVRIIPWKKLAQNPCALGVACFEKRQFLVGKPEHMRHVLVDQPSVLGQLADNFETRSRIFTVARLWATSVVSSVCTMTQSLKPTTAISLRLFLVLPSKTMLRAASTWTKSASDSLKGYQDTKDQQIATSYRASELDVRAPECLVAESDDEFDDDEEMELPDLVSAEEDDSYDEEDIELVDLD